MVGSITCHSLLPPALLTIIIIVPRLASHFLMAGSPLFLPYPSLLVCLSLNASLCCCVCKGTIPRYEQLVRAVQVRRALPALLICLNCIHSEIWSSGLVTRCQNVCYIFNVNVWLDKVRVMPHNNSYSTKYIILQISNAAQNFGLLCYFSSLQHFLFWRLISNAKNSTHSYTDVKL